MRKTLKEELEEYKDKYLRALAELENYKKRVRREHDELVKYANERLILECIPILDDFERGIENCKLQIAKCKMRNKKSGGKERKKYHELLKMFENLYKGIELIKRRLDDILVKEGLEPFTSVGEKFDPKFHEAVSVIESKEPSDIVVSELLKGYKLKDKVIRPAMVTVSKGGTRNH